MNYLFLSAAIIYGYFSYRNFKIGLSIFILLLPTYLIRLKLGPLPTTVLEILFASLFISWLFRHARRDLPNVKMFFVKHFWFGIFFSLFFIASIIGIFISDMWWYSFGQWRAYFFQPMLLFLMVTASSRRLSADDYERALSWTSLSVSLFAVAQRLFSFGLDNNGRSVSFFTSPNAVGLYLAPLTVLVAVNLYKKSQTSKNIVVLAKFKEFWLLLFSAVAIIFTGSLGTVLGLFVAIIIGLFVVGKKRASGAAIIALIVSIMISAFVSPLALQKSQSLSNRFTLWKLTSEYLLESPKNFVFGTGIRQFFRKIQKPHFNQEELERLIYPHNIFLNFWTETGLVGLIAFVGIFSQLIIVVYRQYQTKKTMVVAISAGILSVILIHGLIDVPYFKNDLAMMFWLLVGYIFKLSEENI